MLEGLNLKGDYAALEFVEQKDKTEGGILIPHQAAAPPQKAKVLAIGTGKLLPSGKVIPVDFKVGDKVLAVYSGEVIEYQGIKIRLVKSEDILALEKNNG